MTFTLLLRDESRRRVAALVLLIVLVPGSRVSSGAAAVAPEVSVTLDRGVYHVTAQYTAAKPPATVLAVLTDYEAIPRFMPDVTTSIVRERIGKHVVLEQEAESRVLMFSRRVHLLLDVRVDAQTLSFRDTCGRSFVTYEGAWRVTPDGDGADIRYELVAEPRFEAPSFIVTRVLKKNSARMIEALQTEIAAR